MSNCFNGVQYIYFFDKKSAATHTGTRMKSKSDSENQ